MSELDPEVKKDLLEIQKNLVQKIEKIGNPEVQPVQEQKSKDDQKIDPIIFIATLFLLLLVGVFVYKKFNKEVTKPLVNQQAQTYNNQPYNQSPPIYRNNPQDYQNNSYNLNSNVYNNKFKELDNRLDQLDQRTWLLSVANNENAVVSQRIANVVGRDAEALARKYITFDTNWKLSKTPEFLNLTSTDRYNLLNHVNKNTTQRYIQPQVQPRYIQPQVQHTQPQPRYVQPQVQYTQPQARYVQPQVQYTQPGRVFNWNICH